MRLILVCAIPIFLSCNNGSKNIMNDQETKVQEKSYSPEYVEKHKNGTIKTKGTMINGQREGHWETYYPNGIKQSESDYQNGELTGKSATYYPNGATRYVGEYVDGKQTGSWYFYGEDGKFEKEVVYDNGKIVK